MHEGLMLVDGNRSRAANSSPFFFVVAGLHAYGKQMDCLYRYGAAEMCNTLHDAEGRT